MTERDSTFDSTAELLGMITTRLGAQLSHVHRNGVRRDRPTLVAVGHGSRDPRARAALADLVERVRELRPGLDVRLAHIELNPPLLPDLLTDLTGPTEADAAPAGVPLGPGPALPTGVSAAAGHAGPNRVPAGDGHAGPAGGSAVDGLAGPPRVPAAAGHAGPPRVSGADGLAGPPQASAADRHAVAGGGPPAGRRAVLVPLLFGPGYHVKYDLTAAAAAVPDGRVRIAAPLGPHPLLVEALADRLAEAGWTSADSASRSTGVVLAAAGSRDREGLAAVRRIAAALSERLGGVPVVPAYASAATPTVPEALRVLAARGRHRVAVASCFTAPGLFASRAAAHAPWIASPPLGAHPSLARLVLHRYDEALAALTASAPAATPPSSTSTPAPTPTNAPAPHPVPTWRELASA
ncbi:sirohydrochlorin chelatase [Streptomyces sp. NPDC048370]|uniref:sirohydrochlorin chelatase n=1 Tax=Streptomyces sp. NPDC048370 TaxID=3365540 RepID=UPI00371B379E